MGLDFSDGVVCYFNASQTEKIKIILNFPIIADRILVWRKQSSFGGKGMSRNWQPIFVWRAEKTKSGWDAIDFEFAIPDKTGEHPNQKPIALCEKIIKNNSERNDIVLDLFGGSGSTLIACEKSNRKCRIMEIEPLYVQVIIDRWEKFTGKKVIK